ncbi:AfsR/SARP family transcriptional regulator [Nonomuraea sp. LPB2021202275-12-8]|uniref:AfsR/SARP family transcriptional regulator n=1 Tax=Nonomuraea sp. LPB2021202275-12-8 TaxID=3120159 RepID=UPI00300D6548
MIGVRQDAVHVRSVDGRLRVALLGPFEVRRAAAPVELGTNRLRTLLAILAMCAGETVTVADLVTAIWADDPPVSPRRSVQTYVARLRQELGTEAISTMPSGYRLEAEPDQVDALRFRRLLSEAARSRGSEAERRALEEALALWRGRPFEGIDSDVLHSRKALRLVELHLSAVERRIDLSLAEGRADELIADVQDLAAGHPHREPLWERLLLMLDRSGRRAEALMTYERLRRRLSIDLGIDPSPELRRIHATLLVGDPR